MKDRELETCSEERRCEEGGEEGGRRSRRSRWVGEVKSYSRSNWESRLILNSTYILNQEQLLDQIMYKIIKYITEKDLKWPSKTLKLKPKKKKVQISYSCTHRRHPSRASTPICTFESLAQPYHSTHILFLRSNIAVSKNKKKKSLKPAPQVWWSSPHHAGHRLRSYSLLDPDQITLQAWNSTNPDWESLSRQSAHQFHACSVSYDTQRFSYIATKTITRSPRRLRWLTQYLDIIAVTSTH